MVMTTEDVVFIKTIVGILIGWTLCFSTVAIISKSTFWLKVLAIAAGCLIATAIAIFVFLKLVDGG